MRMCTVVALCALLGISMSASATPTSRMYVITPNDLVASNTAGFADGSSPFGYDQDGRIAPHGTPMDPAFGYDSGSWQASPAGGSTTNPPKDFFGLRISPWAFAPDDGVVMFGELESIVFQTKQLSSGNVGRPDWYLKIYTLPRAGQSGWYGHRYEAFPGDVTDGVWNTWSSDTLLFNEADGEGGGTSAADRDFDDLQALYGDEQIAWIELIAGNNGANVFTSNLDAIEIDVAVSGGSSLTTINLEPVPEPMTAMALFAGLAGLGSYVRRRTA